MSQFKRFLGLAVILCFLLALFPLSLVSADDVTVSIEAPDEVAQGSDFTARVNVTEVTNFDSCQLKVTYNPAVIEVIGAEGGLTGVTAGLIASTPVPVDMWIFFPPGVPGTVFVLGNVPGFTGVTGSGYLAEIHFHVVGSPGDTSDSTLPDGGLFDIQSDEIPVTAWLGDSVHVSTFDADFSVDSGIAGHPTEGYAGVTGFSFSDETSGGVTPYTAWDWNFGDGLGTSTAPNPGYTYPGAGTYTVVLTVTDSSPTSDTETKTDYITVYEALNADFSADSGIVAAYPNPAVDPPTAYPTSGYPGVTEFNFTDESTGGKLPHTGWNWDFGDGLGTSTLQNPGYTYPDAGTYTVILTVTDSMLDNDSETKVEYIRAYEPGDANADGIIDMSDVTKVERIILRIDAPTIWADANQDGTIDMADVTKIERIILGID